MKGIMNGDRRDHNDDSRYGAFGALVWVILFWTLVLAAIAGVKAARADHYMGDAGCRPSIPRVVSLAASLPASARAEAQLAMAAWNLADPRYQWFVEVPWGQPANTWVIPSSGPTSMSTAFSGCQQWGIQLVPAQAALVATHEFGHTLGFSDVIHYWETTPAPWTRYCDGPNRIAYVGIMSYCTWPDWYRWIRPDDQAELRRYFP